MLTRIQNTNEELGRGARGRAPDRDALYARRADAVEKKEVVQANLKVSAGRQYRAEQIAAGGKHLDLVLVAERTFGGAICTQTFEGGEEVLQDDGILLGHGGGQLERHILSHLKKIERAGPRVAFFWAYDSVVIYPPLAKDTHRVVLAHMLLLQLFIGTRWGVRTEHVWTTSPPLHTKRGKKRRRPNMPPEDVPNGVVLHHENRFQSQGVRVASWDAERSMARWVNRVRFCAPAMCWAGFEYDGDQGSGASSSSEEEEECRTLNRKRTFAMMRPPDDDDEEEEEDDDDDDEGLNAARLEIDLTDSDPESVGYVWVVPIRDAAARAPDARRGSRCGIPHPERQFRTENSCGACHTQHELNLDALRCIRQPTPSSLLLLLSSPRGSAPSSPGKTGMGDLITMLSGTFAPCTNRLQVDFRGVRSIERARDDWALMTGGGEEMHMTIYMMVLKACLGSGALVVDHGMRPQSSREEETIQPGSKSYRLMMEGKGRCYLGERMARWCSYYTQHTDVCQAVELVDLRWEALLQEEGGEAPGTLPPALLAARSSTHISRRGGVMLRLIFPRGTPWDECAEAEVLAACNRALRVIRRIAAGKD